MKQKGESIVWESERLCCSTANVTDKCSFTSKTDDEVTIVRKNKNARSISPRPAVVKTTWCDSSSMVTTKEGVQQTLIAEHTIPLGSDEEDQSYYLSEHANATEDDYYQDVYYSEQASVQNNNRGYNEDPTNPPQSQSTIRKRQCNAKRVFQKFWCATEGDEDLQALPRPDGYRLSLKGGSQKRNKYNSSLRRRLWGTDHEPFSVSDGLVYTEETDERGGIRRRPKVWDLIDDAEDVKKDAKFYAPKRPPPILDLLMVLTSFFSAAVLAYYSAT